MNAIIEQEDENLLKREMMIAKEAIYKNKIENQDNSYASVEVLNEQWSKLRTELYQMVIHYCLINVGKRVQGY